MATDAPIYVEIRIHAPMSDLWEKTQNPALHQRWDLRFGEIAYLPKEHSDLPQQFTYAITVAGIRVDGRGETAGERNREDGSRTSALKFWSDHRLSPIKKGSGYWKYVPTDDGIRFFTWYDYTVRWGRFGSIVDRHILRPLMGWGTAWSFDRLRIWLEEGTPPETTLRESVVHHVARLSLGLVWVYQGAVPKLAFRRHGEQQIVEALGIPRGLSGLTVMATGVGETALGVATLARPRWRWPVIAGLGALPALMVAAARADRGLFARPFNPPTLSLATAGLCLAALLSGRETATATRCSRAQQEISL